MFKTVNWWFHVWETWFFPYFVQAYSENTIEEMNDMKAKGGLELAGSLPHSIAQCQRRRINTEDKAKVVAAAWGTELIKFVVCPMIWILKNGMNSS